MALNDDPWIADNSPIEAEKLHAIGLIQFRWNSCELGMRIILTALSGRKFSEVWAEYYDSRPKKLTDQVRKLAIASHHAGPIKDSILRAVELYNVNRLNRNQLSHFLSSATKTGGLEIRNNKNPDFSAIFDGSPVSSDLAAIRRVAQEITTTMRYLSALANYLGAQNSLSPYPLPEKPPVPENHWKPPHP